MGRCYNIAIGQLCSKLPLKYVLPIDLPSCCYVCCSCMHLLQFTTKCLLSVFVFNAICKTHFEHMNSWMSIMNIMCMCVVHIVVNSPTVVYHKKITPVKLWCVRWSLFHVPTFMCSVPFSPCTIYINCNFLMFNANVVVLQVEVPCVYEPLVSAGVQSSRLSACLEAELLHKS